MPDDGKSRTLPTYRDFCPFETLDEIHAAKEFMGKTLEEAELMFHEKCIHHCEDLMWMGTPAFEFYVNAFRNYLFSQHSTGDNSVEGFFDATIPGRLRWPQGLGNAKTVVLECLDYVLENFDRFDIEDTVQPDLTETLNSVFNDSITRQMMEEMWENLYGQPLQGGDLQNMLDELKSSQDLTPVEEKLPTRQRWMKLRDNIKSSA